MYCVFQEGGTELSTFYDNSGGPRRLPLAQEVGLYIFNNPSKKLIFRSEVKKDLYFFLADTVNECPPGQISRKN